MVPRMGGVLSWGAGGNGTLLSLEFDERASFTGPIYATQP